LNVAGNVAATEDNVDENIASPELIVAGNVPAIEDNVDENIAPQDSPGWTDSLIGGLVAEENSQTQEDVSLKIF
jgi:hypothetical protein